MSPRTRLSLAVLLLGAALAGPSRGHEFHFSLAEMELNSESQRFEVALKVQPEALEEALAARHGASVRLEATPGVDELIAAYLRQSFRLTRGSARGGEPLPLHWVGKEVSHREAWLYFEIEAGKSEAGSAPGPAGWTLENRVLFDLSPNEQVNTVLLRIAEGPKTLTFTPREPRQRLPVL